MKNIPKKITKTKRPKVCSQIETKSTSIYTVGSLSKPWWLYALKNSFRTKMLT